MEEDLIYALLVLYCLVMAFNFVGGTLLNDWHSRRTKRGGQE